MKIRIGHGVDVHRLAEGEELWLGGIKIEHQLGCVAHSDGDVVIHAICDAMLGALALGDIGLHFPDTSQDYKGIDSKILLKRVNELIKEKGYVLGNLDTVICMQKPKLRPHIDSMRECIAKILDTNVENISIKATTTEKLGFEGRQEGVSAHCSVLLTTND